MERNEVFKWIRSRMPRGQGSAQARALRVQIHSWFESHPDQIFRSSAKGLLERCENRVRKGARVWTWKRAANFAEEQAKVWEKSWGQHGGERFVSGEICHHLSSELKRSEPKIEDLDEVWPMIDNFFPGISSQTHFLIRRWALEIARDESHALWREIARATKHRGPALADECGFHDEHGWEGTHNYAEIAAAVSRRLAREFDARELH